jgi:3D (Asp-Asp-Asp) domain-containing protein
MKNLFRGGAVMALLSMLVVFIYAQQPVAKTDLTPANESLARLDNTIVDIALFDNNLLTTTDNSVQTDDKKLVKPTSSVKAVGMGASRGAFSATAYCLQGRTAMGHGVRRGIIAADPRVLKLGSRVTINGGGYSGTYLVSDTGGAIKGKRIDIWVPNCSEARKFGRRTVQIYQ